MLVTDFLPTFDVSEEVATRRRRCHLTRVDGFSWENALATRLRSGWVGKFWRPVIEFATVPASRAIPRFCGTWIRKDDLLPLGSGAGRTTRVGVRRDANGDDR
jgi:hypothetical protein